MNPWLVTAAEWIQGSIFLYFLAINFTYTALILFALKDILQHSWLSTARSTRRMLTADTYYKPVTVIVPAYNEGSVISQSVRSLLNLHYPEFEIVVVNDGSSDDTLEALRRDFDLRPHPKPVRLQVPHAPIRGIYVSASYSNLIVVDKENGGKADAINAGINVSAYPLFCSIDADSLLEPDAILKSSKLFIEDDELIATGGIVRVLNGCTVKEGAVLEIGMPSSTLEAIQVLEYTRAFLSGRTGWNMLKSLLIISGAFGVFRKDMVIAINGYRKTVGEDMDLVMRLHLHCLDNKIPYKIMFVPDPVCWTQAPFNLRMLLKQRNRWHRGLIDSLLSNRRLILNPRYGAVSLLGTSYFLFVEVLGPMIELIGYISIPILYFAGLLGVKFLLVITTVAVLWGISINIAAIFLDTFNYRRYKSNKDVLRLCLLSVVEFFGYRQITLLERVRATFDFRSTSWGSQERRDMHAAGEEPSAVSRALALVKGSATAGAAARFFNELPALLLALLAVRGVEIAAGMPAGSPAGAYGEAISAAIRHDLLALVRFLPVLFIASAPFLASRSERLRTWGINVLWGLVLLVQAGLMEYFLTARVPLGSDLLAYSITDLVTTLKGGMDIRQAGIALLGAALALAAFWGVLRALRSRVRLLLKPAAGAVILALSLAAAFLLPGRPAYVSGTEDTYNLALNKSAFFYGECAGYAAGRLYARAGLGGAAPGAGPAYGRLDPAYPFLRPEDTPDTLGPLIALKRNRPPNLVFVIIEGMGRAFTGPGAELGSFTPGLDALAEKGLYWDNFLAVQGRTFGVLPSLFGSLPFGANGFAELGEKMPPHITLLSVLKRAGYTESAYCGENMDFDNDRLFYKRQGVDRLVDQSDFGPGYSTANVWGYADADIFARALKDAPSWGPGPFITVIKTSTMHTPYTFPGQAAYNARFEERLSQLGITGKGRDAYRAYRNIYTSVMYTDAALSRFMEEYSRLPAYADTIFVITGDHRLPELPMSTRLDRYHVPLLVLSPMLKSPARIRAVSSHFDVAPSLLAMLSHGCGIPTPAKVTWLGGALDTDQSFRNARDIPITQTKTDLVDYLSGTRFLSKDLLYDVADGMGIEPSDDAAARGELHSRFAAFKAANASFAASGALMPAGAADELRPYDERARRGVDAASYGSGGLAVAEVRAPDETSGGAMEIEVVLSNYAETDSPAFVPLAIVFDAADVEVSESYGQRRTLGPGGTVTLKMPVTVRVPRPGRYFLTVFPSDPETGKKNGKGRYRVPVVFK